MCHIFTITIQIGTTGKPKGVDVMHSNVTNRSSSVLGIDTLRSLISAISSDMSTSRKFRHGTGHASFTTVKHRFRYGPMGNSGIVS